MLKQVYKLWKQLVKLSEVVTDKGTLVLEDELAVGAKVLMEVEGELVPVENGIYETETHLITVEDGVIITLEEKEKEVIEEVVEETPEVIEMEEQPEVNDFLVRIAELEEIIEKKDAEIADKDAHIAKLEEIIKQKDEELHTSEVKPAKELVKEEMKGAMRFFKG